MFKHNHISKMLVALGLGVLLSIFSAPAQASACDRTSNACLVPTSGPYIPATIVEFTTPDNVNRAGITGASQNQQGVQGSEEASLVSNANGVKTWRFIFHPLTYSTFRDGQVTFEIMSLGCGSCDKFSNPSHSAQVAAKDVRSHVSQRSGSLSFTARRDVKATAIAILKGKKSSGGWKTIAKRSASQRFAAGKQHLKTPSISNAGSRCHAYVQCKLVTKGSVYTRATKHGKWYKSGKDADSRRIK